MPTKIETHLSPEQFLEFCRRCAQLKGGTRLREIQSLAEEFGVSISLMSATSFRDGPLKGYLAELKAKSERAQQVAAFAQSGLSLSDAAAVRLSETVFDELMGPSAEALTAEERDTYSRIIARARSGDQNAKKLEAALRALEQKLSMQQFDAAKAVLEHAKKIRLITASTKLDAAAKTERVRKLLFGERPADFKPITGKGAESA